MDCFLLETQLYLLVLIDLQIRTYQKFTKQRQKLLPEIVLRIEFSRPSRLRGLRVQRLDLMIAHLKHFRLLTRIACSHLDGQPLLDNLFTMGMLAT